jgi:subfamily B ATP-binding cassette protein HlyB/CyaB
MRAKPTATIELALAADDFLWAIGSLCNLRRKLFDASLIQREFPPPHSALTLVEALRSLELDARVVELDARALFASALPRVVFLGMGGDETAPPRFAPALLAKVEDARVLVFPAGTNEPRVGTARRVPGAVHRIFVRGRSQRVAGAGRRRLPRGPRVRVPVVRRRAVASSPDLAGRPARVARHATDRIGHTAVQPGDHRQGDRAPDHEHAHGHRFRTCDLRGVRGARSDGCASISSRIRGTVWTPCWAPRCSATSCGCRCAFSSAGPTGVLAARLNGVETIREFLSGAAITLLLDLPFLLLFLALMFFYSAWLSLVTLGVLALVVALSAAVAPLFQSKLNEQFLRGARNQAFVTEYVAGVETVKALQMEPQLERRYEEYLASYLQANFATRQLANSYNTVAGGLEQLLNMAILCFGAWLVMRGPDFTIGMLVAFQMFAARVSQPMLKLVGLWQQFQQAAIAVRRLADVMDVPAEPWTVTSTREVVGAGAIEFRNVGYRYASDRSDVLRGFNLRIAPGECVVVMGPSGSGKSTLTKLLQGFLWPTEGQVLLDGRDSRHLAANELRSYFGVVPQETILFCGSILDNLLLANPLATFDMAMQSARLAEIHETIERPAVRLQDGRRRTRCWTLGWAEAAHRDRARAFETSANPDLRRSDERPRCRGRRSLRGHHRPLQGQGHDSLRDPSCARKTAA